MQQKQFMWQSTEGIHRYSVIFEYHMRKQAKRLGFESMPLTSLGNVFWHQCSWYSRTEHPSKRQAECEVSSCEAPQLRRDPRFKRTERLGSPWHTNVMAVIPLVVLFSSSFTIMQTENHNHRKLTNLITWTTALSNSMKLWAMPCMATQDGQVMVERSDKMLSTGEGNGKPLKCSCLENPMNSMKRQKDRTLKDKLPRLVGAQYATGNRWENNPRKNEDTEPKQK